MTYRFDKNLFENQLSQVEITKRRLRGNQLVRNSMKSINVPDHYKKAERDAMEIYYKHKRNKKTKTHESEVEEDISIAKKPKKVRKTAAVMPIKIT